MLCIPNTNIWIGNASDLRDIPSVLNNGVAAIIDLAAEEPFPTIPRATSYCRFALTDDGENNAADIQAAILAASTFVSVGLAIAICCSAGLSRSPSVAAATMSFISGDSLVASLELVSAVKHIDVSPAFWNQVVGVFSNMDAGTLYDAS